MSFSGLFIIGIIALAVVTAIIVVLLNLLFRSLEKRFSKLLKIKPSKVSTETLETKITIKPRLVALNILLAICIFLLEFVLILGDTVLNPGFVVDELQKLDVGAVTTEMLSKQSSGQQYGAESIKATLTELEPLLREQASTAIYSAYDYFLGNEPDINVLISLESLQKSLRKNLEEEILKSPPLELRGASPEQIQSYVDGIYQQLFEHVPTKLELSLKTSTADVVTRLKEIRRVTAFLLLLPKILMPLFFALIAVIILLYRDVKIATRTLGITLFIAGILGYLYAFIAKEAGMQSVGFTFLPSLNLWLIQLVTDVLVLVKLISPILFAVGGVMLIISFFWRLRHEAGSLSVTETGSQ